jgi:hypothetical protein
MGGEGGCKGRECMRRRKSSGQDSNGFSTGEGRRVKAVRVGMRRW